MARVSGYNRPKKKIAIALVVVFGAVGVIGRNLNGRPPTAAATGVPPTAVPVSSDRYGVSQGAHRDATLMPRSKELITSSVVSPIFGVHVVLARNTTPDAAVIRALGARVTTLWLYPAPGGRFNVQQARQLVALVPLSQSEILYRKLQEAGVPATLVVVKNAGHSFMPQGGPISPSREEITRLVADFFDKHLK